MRGKKYEVENFDQSFFDGSVRSACRSNRRVDFAMIQIKAARIASGRNISLTPTSETQRNSESSIHVLLCERYSHVTVPAGMVGLWCPLHDGVWAEALGARFFVRRESVYTSDPDYGHEISVPMRGASIAILARHSVWCQLMSMCPADRHVLPTVFPANQTTPVGLRLAMLHLVRKALDGPDLAESQLIEYFGQLMLKMQRHFLPLLQRCPGSSNARRCQIFLRLQRARHLIQTDPSRNIDISALAAISNYSSSQFIRIFNRVFGETPYSQLLRLRIEFARQLIRETRMNMNDVWRASGFENRASFTRSFKMHSGSTASAFRSSLRLPH